MKRDQATPPLVHEAIASLQRLADAFIARRRQLAAGVGLTVEEWRFLEEISQEHFMPSLFARERDSSRAAVSKILRQLQDKGLVLVSVHPENRRRRDYELTARGREVLARLRARRQHAIDAVWADLPPAQLQQFLAFSDTLNTRLETYANQSHD
jgi:DNA-binding MarR family transcriptional regulator